MIMDFQFVNCVGNLGTNVLCRDVYGASYLSSLGDYPQGVFKCCHTVFFSKFKHVT